ncbi:Ws0399_0 protein [Plakobranchus ocellatus]|uniref:Ws0399_0 protein n=1 Tax=Plakobranchus ocellatus TaxID=259542 RepID=A0AAV4AN91_9GAST|nr:Ws0399_0 protein [Plakobranchus ocellatus]
MDPGVRKMQPTMTQHYGEDMSFIDFDSRMIRAITQQQWASPYQPPPQQPHVPPSAPPQPQQPQLHRPPGTQPLALHALRFSGKDIPPPVVTCEQTPTVLDIGQTAGAAGYQGKVPKGPNSYSSSTSYQVQTKPSSHTSRDDPPTQVHVRRLKPQKRQRNPELWKKNIKKRMRQTGQAYTTDTGREVPARRIHEGCGSSCRLKCHENFDPDSREDLFQTFWSLEDKRQQRQYIARHVIKCDVARKRVENSERRGFTLKYYFYDGKGLLQVCRKFFVETLDVGRDFIYGTLEKEDPKTGLIAPERQGKHGKQRRVSEAILNSVREHIASFPVADTQKGKSKSKRRYLDAGLSVAKMYRMYKEYCAARNIHDVASADRYRRVFDEDFNLAFLKVKKT